MVFEPLVTVQVVGLSVALLAMDLCLKFIKLLVVFATTVNNKGFIVGFMLQGRKVASRLNSSAIVVTLRHNSSDL